MTCTINGKFITDVDETYTTFSGSEHVLLDADGNDIGRADGIRIYHVQATPVKYVMGDHGPRSFSCRATGWMGLIVLSSYTAAPDEKGFVRPFDMTVQFTDNTYGWMPILRHIRGIRLMSVIGISTADRLKPEAVQFGEPIQFKAYSVDELPLCDKCHLRECLCEDV
jgi:hypothetical protein